MARYQHPEQTLENILTTASTLFLEKGYDQTNIQDILDALHLSKGGLYHHFSSKEEILEAVMKRHAQQMHQHLKEMITKTKADNAKGKLKQVLWYLATDASIHRFDNTMRTQVKNPYFVVNGMYNCIRVDAPAIAELIQEGIDDHSIKTSDPDLCAEVFLMLINYWVNPFLYDLPSSDAYRRLTYLKKLMSSIGLDIIDDDLMEIMKTLYQETQVK